MAKKVPVQTPWDARRANAWDAQSVRTWLNAAHVPTRLARDLIEATVRACFAADLSESRCSTGSSSSVRPAGLSR